MATSLALCKNKYINKAVIIKVHHVVPQEAWPEVSRWRLYIRYLFNSKGLYVKGLWVCLCINGVTETCCVREN